MGLSKCECRKAGLLARVSVCVRARARVCVWVDGPQKPGLTGQMEDGSGEPQSVVLVARVRPPQIPAPLPYKPSAGTASDTRT